MKLPKSSQKYTTIEEVHKFTVQPKENTPQAAEKADIGKIDALQNM